MPILAQLSDMAQKALDRQEQWTASDFAEIGIWLVVCVGSGFLIDAALRWLIAKKSA
jgi:hypothetical protein